MQYGHCRILLCGDIEAEAEEALVAAGDDLRADVLLAPHHGSASSSTPGFVAAVHPRAVIFSVGASKALGNPDPEVVARYQAAGARVFRTDTQGSIQVTTDGRRLTVRAHTGGAKYEAAVGN
jgi:competence protein ComEC